MAVDMDLLDSLILGYLERRKYDRTSAVLINESPSLSKNAPKQNHDVCKLHGKILEEIVGSFAELGSFVVPPRFMDFGLKLRQLSSEFAMLTGAGWSETQQQLYGRKTTLPTRTQAVSLVDGVRNVQTEPSNFTLLRQERETVVSDAAADVSSLHEKTDSSPHESRRRKAPPRHLANTDVISSLTEANASQHVHSAFFPPFTFDTFGSLIESDVPSMLADGINRNRHDGLSPTHCAIAELLDDPDFFKGLAMEPSIQHGDGGLLVASDQLQDGSLDDEELLHGWDHQQIGLVSPTKTVKVVIDEVEEGEIAEERPTCSKMNETSEKRSGANVAVAANPIRPSTSSSMAVASVSQGIGQPPTKSSKPVSNSVEPVISPNKTDDTGKSKKNKKSCSVEPTDVPSSSSASVAAAPSIDPTQTTKLDKKKHKSTSSDSSNRHSSTSSSAAAPSKEIKKKERRDKEKEKEKEKDDGKKKNERIMQSPHVNKEPTGKRPFALTHVVTKRLYPEHQCSSKEMMFANTDLFEAESPKRKRPKNGPLESDSVFDSILAQKNASPGLESARRALTDSIPALRSPPAPPSSGKDKSKEEHRPRALTNGKQRRDKDSPEITRVRRSESRSPSSSNSSATSKIRSRSSSIREPNKELRHKDKTAQPEKQDRNRGPNGSVASKPPPPPQTSSKGSLGSTKRKGTPPQPKTVCSGVGKYKPIQLVGGSHSAKVGIVLEKAARARRQAEKDKVNVSSSAPAVLESAAVPPPRPAQSSQQLPLPITMRSTFQSSPLKRTEQPLDDSELIDMATNSALADAMDRDLVVLRMLDEGANPVDSSSSTGIGSVQDLAAYCERQCGFRLNLPDASPPKVVRLDSARMESVLARLHGARR